MKNTTEMLIKAALSVKAVLSRVKAKINET